MNDKIRDYILDFFNTNCCHNVVGKARGMDNEASFRWKEPNITMSNAHWAYTLQLSLI